MAADAELNLSFIEKKLGTVGRIAYYAALVGLYSLIPLIKNDLGAVAGGFLESLGLHPEQIVEIEEFGDFSSNLHGIIGLVLGLLLVFRTNSSYSRWWEARKLWGRLVNVTRNMAIKFREFTNFNRDELRELAGIIVAFP
ncbi:MAG TPA: hypothetical protein DDZ90_34280, partial [Planctomycetaceae bacterium]|nr:hypothetical protein [Planctomycetaceae bacterium]